MTIHVRSGSTIDPGFTMVEFRRAKQSGVAPVLVAYHAYGMLVAVGRMEVVHVNGDVMKWVDMMRTAETPHQEKRALDARRWTKVFGVHSWPVVSQEQLDEHMTTMLFHFLVEQQLEGRQ